MDIYQELLQELKKKNFSEKELSKLKRELSVKYNLSSIPTNIEILLHASSSELSLLKKKLLTKPIRTISGIAPLAIMTKPSPCPHGKCTFCPGGINSPWGDIPQSYTGHEPATMRAMRNEYDSYRITFNRLEQYLLLGHSIDKIEIIIMGGTFPATPRQYQEEVIIGAFQALNDFSELFFDAQGNFLFESFKTFFELPGKMLDQQRSDIIREKVEKLRKKTTLEAEQERNETTKVRCVALCIETKPDWGFLEQGVAMLKQGCTRVELGIESVYDDVLAYTHRGHTSADSKKSIQILRDLGFKINFHYMPGMPLTDKKRDIAGMKQLFDDQDYRPDMIKYYPCMVAPGTALYQQYKQGTFTPITTQEAAERLISIKEYTPEYCRIQRIQRDVPTKYWEAGVDKTNLRQYMVDNYTFKCRCIRCREPKNQEIDWDKVDLKVMEYDASGGKEFFISAEDIKNDVVIGFCRLRFPAQFLLPEITKEGALIRELHVNGTATAIGEEGMIQHKGWGKKLLKTAEDICIKHKKNKVIVISGIGVREYYRKLGYEKEGMYMIKYL